MLKAGPEPSRPAKFTPAVKGARFDVTPAVKGAAVAKGGPSRRPARCSLVVKVAGAAVAML